MLVCLAWKCRQWTEKHFRQEQKKSFKWRCSSRRTRTAKGINTNFLNGEYTTKVAEARAWQDEMASEVLKCLKTLNSEHRSELKRGKVFGIAKPAIRLSTDGQESLTAGNMMRFMK